MGTWTISMCLFVGSLLATNRLWWQRQPGGGGQRRAKLRLFAAKLNHIYPRPENLSFFLFLYLFFCSLSDLFVQSAALPCWGFSLRIVPISDDYCVIITTQHPQASQPSLLKPHCSRTNHCQKEESLGTISLWLLPSSQVVLFRTQTLLWFGCLVRGLFAHRQ